MTKDDTVYLREILDSIAQVQAYLQDVTYETFLAERMRQDAVIMQIEILANLRANFLKIFGRSILKFHGCK